MASAASGASEERVESEAPGVYAQERMGSEESMESVLPPWKRPRAAASAAPGVYAKECMGSSGHVQSWKRGQSSALMVDRGQTWSTIDNV